MIKVSKLLCGGDLSFETLKAAERSTFVILDKPTQQYSSFIISIILSSIIATGGIAADSTAVAVGSMLVAPLMSPMIGTALAAVMGRPKSTLRALAITTLGMVAAIVVSMLVAMAIPITINTSSNTQILARTAPRLTDLIIALASSLMAAISIMRADIPTALAGVAISASIIPPLCVVGVALAVGDFTAAEGSFLLFLTNFFAIQVGGMIVFAAMGLGKSVYSEASKRMRALWYTCICACVIAVSVPLTVTSNSVVSNSMEEKAIQTCATAWLADTDYHLNSISVEDGHVTLEVVGSGKEPSMKKLSALLKKIGVEAKDIRMAVIHESIYRLDGPNPQEESEQQAAPDANSQETDASGQAADGGTTDAAQE